MRRVVGCRCQCCNSIGLRRDLGTGRPLCFGGAGHRCLVEVEGISGRVGEESIQAVGVVIGMASFGGPAAP